MSLFPVNTTRQDPYKNFKFRLKWDGRYVAGLSQMTPLTQSGDVLKRSKYDAITLSRGVTHDTAFGDWANFVMLRGAGPGAEMSLKSFRKDISLDVFDEAGEMVSTYRIFHCWVSEYLARAEPDSHSSAVAIQTLKVECEGWEREAEVGELAERHAHD